MFFKKKPAQPLKEAMTLINQASEIIMQHKRNKGYMPTSGDMGLLRHIESHFHNAAAMTGYVERCMQQRLEGKPEGAAKFNDDEVMDYHYPSR